MSKSPYILFFVLASLLQALPLQAQDAVGQQSPQRVKEVINAKMLGIGAVNILDTYLSPEQYTGTGIHFIDQTERQRRTLSPGASSPTIAIPGCLSPDARWLTTLTHQAQLSFARPRSEDASDIYGLYTFTYARQRRWHLMDNRLELRVGAQAEAGIGFLYNNRNGNNPAQGRAYLNIGPNAAASFGFPFFGKPAAVHYAVTVPLLGVLFSPNYGQSYYELFSRGNYDHNVVFTTPFCAPSMRHMLSLDFTVSKTTLRIGYLGDIQQAKVNNLKYQTYSHLFLIGFVRNFEIRTRK